MEYKELCHTARLNIESEYRSHKQDVDNTAYFKLFTARKKG